MGLQNTFTKNYMSRNDIFAELFNYYIFDGRPVLSSENLHEADPTQSVVLADKSGRQTVTERYRDILKQGIFKHNNLTGFLLIGMENQTTIDFAMPVRSMLYDSLTYVRQVSETASKHRRKGNILSSGEFLSGFTAEDTLV